MPASHAEAQNHIISVVEGSRDGRQIDLANGRWDNSPIELIVYGFDVSHNAEQTLRSALCDVAQPTKELSRSHSTPTSFWCVSWNTSQGNRHRLASAGTPACGRLAWIWSRKWVR